MFNCIINWYDLIFACVVIVNNILIVCVVYDFIYEIEIPITDETRFENMPKMHNCNDKCPLWCNECILDRNSNIVCRVCGKQ